MNLFFNTQMVEGEKNSLSRKNIQYLKPDKRATELETSHLILHRNSFSSNCVFAGVELK